jgi:hypothetical protein
VVCILETPSKPDVVCILSYPVEEVICNSILGFSLNVFVCSFDTKYFAQPWRNVMLRDGVSP